MAWEDGVPGPPCQLCKGHRPQKLQGQGPLGKQRPDHCSRAGTFPQAASRKEVHTAQWEGVGKHSHDPHCFPLQSQLGQAQHREFPTLGQ